MKGKMAKTPKIDLLARTIIVTNFSSKTTPKDLHHFFSKYGKVEAVMMKQKFLKEIEKKEGSTDKSSVTRERIAHIRFTEKEMLQEALKAHLAKINEDTLHVSFPEQTNVHRLFVRNLSQEVTEDDLKSHFAHCGEIEDIAIVQNQKKLVDKRGYGFITFKSVDAVEKALKLNCKKFMGHSLVVKIDKKSMMKFEKKLSRKETQRARRRDRKKKVVLALKTTKITGRLPNMKKLKKREAVPTTEDKPKVGNRKKTTSKAKKMKKNKKVSEAKLEVDEDGKYMK